MEPQSTTPDRRKQPRSPAYMGGLITTDRRLIAIDCVVRNMSGAGAKLRVANATLLPEEFELHIAKTETASRVRTRWRREHELGVEIIPLAAHDAPVPLALARRIKRLEAENAGLKQRLGEGA
ncbi:MAG TPA: PilZ domain-containing protein [Xanthobacteraceae bacterium]|nr:PilZ domain-containing protein [Xanthobacteraceae bacterium]